MERKFILPLLILFGILMISNSPASGQSSIQKSSIFWEITGKNLQQPSYLFGTFHLLNENYLNKYKEWQKKFNTAQAVMVEMVLDSSKMMDMVGKMVSPDTTLDKLLSAEEYKIANNYFEEVSGQNLGMFNSLKPISLSVVLTMYTWAKLKPEDYVKNDLPMDLLFVKKAKRRAVPVIPFEFMEEQLSLLYDGISLKRQKEILMSIVKDKKKTEDNILRMDLCYRNQDLNCLQELIYSEESYNKEELDKLLKRRNLKWMEKITATIDGKSTFIAVGAGHLTGDYGLIKLLTDQGYVLTPIVF